jgi:phage tail protein X
MAATLHVRTHQHDTVDALCWRHLGQTHTMVETTLALNPGLAARGLFLDAGVAVTLPLPGTFPGNLPSNSANTANTPRADRTAPGQNLIQLWD